MAQSCLIPVREFSATEVLMRVLWR